jgi:hypothetical protein
MFLMKTLEMITRSALESGNKEDVLNAFHPSKMSPAFLVLALGEQGRTSGVSELLLALMERDNQAVFIANKLILQHAAEICPFVDPHCLKRLVTLIKDVMGVGKAAFYAVLKHMPEDFAVIQFKQWQNAPGSLQQVTLSMQESALTHSLANGRYKIAHALCAQMKQDNALHEVQQVLKDLLPEELVRTALEKYLPAERHVILHCNAKSYSQAISVADGHAALEGLVRQSIAGQCEFSGRNETWGDLFENLMGRVEETIDQQLLINRYKSAATVIFEKVLAMDSETSGRELRSDRLRLLAYQLGLEHVLHDMKDGSYQAKALEIDLGL